VELLLEQARLSPLLASVAIVALSYLGARLVSFLAQRFLGQAQGTTGLQQRLVLALRRPLTYALFLCGARLAVEWLPVGERWAARLHQGLFVLDVGCLTLVAIRAYVILLQWYVTDSGRVAQDGPARDFRPLFSKLGKLLIASVAAVTVLEGMGVNVESLVVSLGVGSLAVGLAAKDTLANMFAGFTIMLDRPFHLGDRIQLSSGEVGDVEAIGMRVTRLKTLDETMLVVPNSLLVQDRIANRNRPTRHLTTRVPVWVADGTDLGRAKTVLAAAVPAQEA
jgi:MscS family membrane protein